MDKSAMWNKMIGIIKQDVTPATGCTEPIALAYAAATAARELGEAVRFVDARVSANLMKNGMGVTVPGTGTPGLYIAAAVGALGGDAGAGLQVLKALTPDVVALGKQYVADGKVTVSVREDTPHVLYAEAVVYGENHRVRVVITDDHTNIVFVEKDGQVLLDQRTEAGSGEDPKIAFLHTLTLADIVDFAEHVPLADIAFLQEAERLNDQLSQEGLTGKYGLKIGYTLQKMVDKDLLSDDLSHRIQIRTVAASDARMGGAAFPAMTNSGSGNQGITATMPVVAAAHWLDIDEPTMLRAVTLSNLIAIRIKSKFGRLSNLCGATVAGTGAACGITYLLGGGYHEICCAIQNMVGNVTGMVCDGAKADCALKISTCVNAACQAAAMGVRGVRVQSTDGIVEHNVEYTLDNFATLSTHGTSDSVILDLMLNKHLPETE